MNRKRILLSNMVVFSLLFSARACPVVVPGTGTLTLKLTKTTDDKTVLPGATVYMAKLFNNTDRTVTVEAIQTAGEYEGGEGKFYNCVLEGWNPAKRQWLPYFTAELGKNPRFVELTLAPGNELQTCNLSVKDQAASGMTRFRYKMRLRWRGQASSSVVSNAVMR